MKAEIKERIKQIEQGIVPKGYKETKVGIIPEEWEVKKLKDILIKNQLGGNYKTIDSKTKYPLIKMGNLGRGKINLTKLEYLDEDETPSENDRLKYGDFLFNTRNSLDLVGKVSIWREELPLVYYNSNIMRMTFSKCDNFFMNNLFNSKRLLKNLRSIATGTTSVAAIYIKDLITLNLALPNLQEQEKIASILTHWDSIIEEQERLIEEKKESFNVITRGLLNKKRRFTGFSENWKKLKLEEFVTPVVREVKRPSEPYEALGIRSHCKGTFHKFVENPEEVDMDSLYEVKADDLIVNITFAWEHAIAIANPEDEGRLVSHRFPTYEIKKEKIDLQFLRALIRQPRLKYMLGLISPGGAGRNRVLNKKDFLKLEFNLPPLEEQKKIGNFLSKLNEEILLQEEKLNLIREEKKILMQLLLTGIIRV